MAIEGRPAFDLLAEWLANDHPMNHMGREVVEKNRAYKLNYGDGLRDLVLDVRSNPNGYRTLVREFSQIRAADYPNGYPVEMTPVRLTMRAISDRDFGALDWTALADLVFPVTDES